MLGFGTRCDGFVCFVAFGGRVEGLFVLYNNLVTSVLLHSSTSILIFVAEYRTSKAFVHISYNNKKFSFLYNLQINVLH